MSVSVVDVTSGTGRHHPRSPPSCGHHRTRRAGRFRRERQQRQSHSSQGVGKSHVPGARGIDFIKFQQSGAVAVLHPHLHYPRPAPPTPSPRSRPHRPCADHRSPRAPRVFRPLPRRSWTPAPATRRRPALFGRSSGEDLQPHRTGAAGPQTALRTGRTARAHQNPIRALCVAAACTVVDGRHSPTLDALFHAHVQRREERGEQSGRHRRGMGKVRCPSADRRHHLPGGTATVLRPGPEVNNDRRGLEQRPVPSSHAPQTTEHADTRIRPRATSKSSESLTATCRHPLPLPIRYGRHASPASRAFRRVCKFSGVSPGNDGCCCD